MGEPQRKDCSTTLLFKKKKKKKLKNYRMTSHWQKQRLHKQAESYKLFDTKIKKGVNK